MMRALVFIFLCLMPRNQAFQIGKVATDSRTFKRNPSPLQFQRVPSIKSTCLWSSTSGDDDMEDLGRNTEENLPNYSANDNSVLQRIIDGVPFIQIFRPDGYKKLPPIQVEDLNVLFYDVFLIVNLCLSISFWVTHRLDLEFLPSALNEGCLFSILWILSGLYHGSFLMSSVDGHYGSSDERGGPTAAAALALNTFVSTVNLRLVFALVVAILQHRPIGMDAGEQILPLEIGIGLVLMSGWRALHSSVTPRI